MRTDLTDREVKDEILLLLDDSANERGNASPLDIRHELVIDDDRITRLVADMVEEDLVKEGTGSSDRAVYLSELRPKGEDLKPKGVRSFTASKLGTALGPVEEIAERLGVSSTTLFVVLAGLVGFLFGLVW